jgi:hypothetical protein
MARPFVDTLPNGHRRFDGHGLIKVMKLPKTLEEQMPPADVDSKEYGVTAKWVTVPVRKNAVLMVKDDWQCGPWITDKHEKYNGWVRNDSYACVVVSVKAPCQKPCQETASSKPRWPWRRIGEICSQNNMTMAYISTAHTLVG